MSSQEKAWWVFDPAIDRPTYLHKLLTCYRQTPTVAAKAHANDRRLASRLYDDKAPLKAVLAAFLLAASRRRFRTPEAPALQPIRSLSYFLPIIDEIIDTPIDPGYIAYLWSKLTDEMGSFWQL